MFAATRLQMHIQLQERGALCIIVSVTYLYSVLYYTECSFEPPFYSCAFQISVKANLSVGSNLQDHVWPIGLEYSLEEGSSFATTEEWAKSMFSLLDYLIFGQGVGLVINSDSVYKASS